MQINMALHNEFDIIVRDAKTGTIIKKGHAENVILDRMWTDFLSAAHRKTDYIHFGSGSTPPLQTDTSLTSFIAGIACSTDSIDSSTFYSDGVIKRKRSIRLNDTAYIGSSISEVGFGWSSTSSYLLTKALVQDENGNPLSIVKESGQIIDIFGTLYIKAPTNLDGVYFDKTTGSYSVLGTLVGNCQYPNPTPRLVLGDCCPKSAMADGVYGDYSDSTSSVTPVWDSTLKRLRYSLPNLVAGSYNSGGFDAIYLGGMTIKLPRSGFSQPVLTKEVVGTGDGITKDFACSFGMILNNGSAKLYVNDVEVSATFDYEVPNFKSNASKSMNSFLKTITSPYSRLMSIFENPYVGRFSLNILWAMNCIVYASNDLSTWALIGTRVSNRDISVPAQYQQYRYWKCVSNDGINPFTLSSWYPLATVNNIQIHADSAPPAGSTIALTYQPKLMAKDANHVINNIVIDVTLNEYTP